MDLLKGWDRLLSDMPDFFTAFFFVTLKVSIIGALCALAVGVFSGLLSASRSKWIRLLTRGYVEIFQNTPILIQIFFIYIGLPYTGIILPETLIAIIVITLYHGAYISEIVRSGIRAVPKGQYEAAHAQGFSYLQSMRYIILPQTLKLVLPPLTTQIVNLIKNTSVLQVIAGGDVMYIADCWAANTGITAPPYLLATILYFSICYPLTCLSRYFEKRNSEGYIKKRKSTKGQVATMHCEGEVTL